MSYNATITRKVFPHLLAWAGYYIFWFFQYRSTESNISLIAAFTTVQMLIHMAAVYVNNLVLIERLLYRQRHILFFALYVLLALGAGILHYKLNSILFTDPYRILYESRNAYEAVMVTFMLIIFVTSIPAWYKVNSDRLKADNQAKQLLNDKIQEELKFLKAQINPHFLFNSLNTVFNLIDSNREEAKSTLVKFSEILRYQLYETANDTISLLKEIEYIYSFAAIEKIRRGESLNVDIVTDINTYVEVPPMLLLTFVENAFKHVSGFDKGNYILIEISTTEQEFLFRSINSATEGIRTGRRSTGIGLSNIRRRLNLIYPDNYSLHIDHDNNTFSVSLTINLNRK